MSDSRIRMRGAPLAPWLLLLLAATLAAPPARGADAPDPFAVWQQNLDKADQALRKGDFKKVPRQMRGLLAEMSEKLAVTPAAAPLVARAEAALALAEAGLGDARAAAWDWQVATGLAPSLARLDLAPYGEAGRRLAAARDAEAALPAPAEGVTPPARKRGQPVSYPISRLLLCDPAPVEVAVTVDPDGEPRRPRLDPDSDPVLSWILLETLRNWHFAPGLLGGAPVAAPFALRAELTQPTCKDLLARQRRSAPGSVFTRDEEEGGGED